MERIPSYEPDLSECHVSYWNLSLKKLRNSSLEEKLRFASWEEFVNFVKEAKKREDEHNWNDDPSFRSPLSIRCLAEDPLGQDSGSLSMLPKKIWLSHVFLKLGPEDLISLSSVNTTLRSWLFYQPNLSSSPFGDNLWRRYFYSITFGKDFKFQDLSQQLIEKTDATVWPLSEWKRVALFVQFQVDTFYDNSIPLAIRCAFKKGLDRNEKEKEEEEDEEEDALPSNSKDNENGRKKKDKKRDITDEIEVKRSPLLNALMADILLTVGNWSSLFSAKNQKALPFEDRATCFYSNAVGWDWQTSKVLMDMSHTCLLDPLHGLDELNSLVQVAEDQGEETDFLKNDMDFARNSLWLFSSSMDEDSSVSGFVLPSKVLREREPKKRRLVLDLEKLPMVQFNLQEPRLMLSAPNLQTWLLKGSFEVFWEWMVARNLVRNEDREPWKMKLKEADDDEQELSNFDRPTEDENGILLDLKKAFIDAADAVEQEELTSSPNNSSGPAGSSTGEKRGSFSTGNEETQHDGKRRKHNSASN